MSNPTVIEINPDDPASIRRALETEWLLTNGLGGYAMGTLLGVNTRRYHGLLVAATKPPVGRIVALHSMIEQLIIPREDAPGGEEIIDLSTQMFVGADGEPMLHPQGWRQLRRLEEVAPNGWPWIFERDGIEIWKGVGSTPSSTALHYTFHTCPRPMRLRLRPIVPVRDFHSMWSPGNYDVKVDEKHVQVTRDDCVVSISVLKPWRWIDDPQWWRQFAYVQDRERGQDWVEDAWSPGIIECPIDKRMTVMFVLRGAAKGSSPAPADYYRAALITNVKAPFSTHDRLLAAASQFVVRRQVNDQWTWSIIAGYPWFSDWGRDTMIALPGLMLCTGRLDEARSCLELFAQHMRNGLIPNFFDDSAGGAGVHYNTVDASLWFVHAVHEYWRALGRSDPGRSPGLTASKRCDSLLEACRAVIAAYRDGTDFNIHMDRDDALIIAGDETTQLTWMDAKRDGVVFTPRHGKAVEINALWINALGCVEEMTEDERERTELWALSRKAAASFRRQFWWPERGCLHDVLTPDVRREATSGGGPRQFVPDGKLRPNQIFAVSLPFSALDDDEQKRGVVKVVGERLLTPFGLRTLDRDDADYRGRFEGDLFERDRAYHNGTVWPWLIGPYCEALLRVEKFSADAKRRVRAIIQPLIDEMSNLEGGRCVGQIAEVYDGDPPHRPGGCPAQAWSVAEVLRIFELTTKSTMEK